MRHPRTLAVLAAFAVAGAAIPLGLLMSAGRPDPAPTPGAVGLASATLPSVAPASAGPDASTPPPPVAPPPIGSTASPMSEHLSGDVYGYLPYWEMNAGIEAYLDWNALSAIALFSVTQHTNGTLVSTAPGYMAITSEQGRRIIATAKGRGVHTEIVFTSFGTKNAAFFADEAAQARTISGLRDLVASVGAEGVDVDVETLAGTWFPAYAAFCSRLRAALRLDNPTATVTVATNANTSGARMAKAALDQGVDRAFMMGYAYRSSGSDPGAMAPLDYRGDATKLDLRASLDRYVQYGVPLSRVILGLPLYGMSWPTAGPALGDPNTAAGTSFIPRSHLDELAANAASIALEPVESVEWFAWQDLATGAWHQTFFDLPGSLQPKFQLAIDRGLAGIGFWALGYDRGLAGYWDLLETMFGPPKMVAVAAPLRTRERTVAVSIAVVPGSRALATVQLSADGTTWSAPVPVPPLPGGAGPDALRPGLSWTIPGTRDGAYRLWARAVDDTGTTSRARSTTVTLDRTGPSLPSAPTIWWSSSAHAWRARWAAATDGSGIGGYRVRVRVGNGAWRTVAAATTARGIVLGALPRNRVIRVEIRALDRLGNWGAVRVGSHRP